MKLRSAHHITSHHIRSHYLIILTNGPIERVYYIIRRMMKRRSTSSWTEGAQTPGRSVSVWYVGIFDSFVLFHLVITHQNTTPPQYCSDAWISSPYPIFVISFILKILPEWLRNAFLSFLFFPKIDEEKAVNFHQ